MQQGNDGWVRVGDVCRLACAGAKGPTASQRAQHRGPYPLYAENCVPYGIDDYAIEAGGTVMVSALGQVLTSRGTLVAALERGRCSGSEHVHALVPHDRRDAAYVWRALTTSPQAARHVVGTSQLRQLSSAGLLGARIPWPSADERAAFVRALDELDAARDRAAQRIPAALAAADAVFEREVAQAQGCEVRTFCEVCAPQRGTDVPASLRQAGKPARVEGPQGGLGHCDEVLTQGPAVVVGPSARRLLCHYVDVPCHPISETTYVTAESCEIPLPVLLFALRHAGVFDRLRTGGVLIDAPRLQMDELPGLSLRLGTPEARAAFLPVASDAVAQVCELEREVAHAGERRDELVRAFFARPQQQEAAETQGERLRADVRVALDGLAPLVEEHSFGLGAADFAWELAPLMVLRRCLPADSWERVAQAACDQDDSRVVPAIDAALAELAEADDLLAFLPNLAYASSLLSEAQLAELVRLLDEAPACALSADALRALLDLGEEGPNLSSGALDVLAGLAQAVAPQPEAVYVPVEATGQVADLVGRIAPAAMVRAQFDDFSRMLAAAMVRAVETLPAHESRGGMGAAQGMALLADEFADLAAPLVVAAVPASDDPWCDRPPAKDDPRWVLGTPPRSKAELAWLQHALAHQAPGGATVLVMRIAPLHSASGSEPVLRRALVERRRVRCVVSLPAQACGEGQPALAALVLGDEGCAPETLFVDALGLATPLPCADPAPDAPATSGGEASAARLLAHEAVERVLKACRGWLAEGVRPHEAGFARVVDAERILQGAAVLTPWTYV